MNVGRLAVLVPLAALLGASCARGASHGAGAQLRLLDRNDRPLVLAKPQQTAVRARVDRELRSRAPSSIDARGAHLTIHTTLAPETQARVDEAMNIVPATDGRFQPVFLVEDTRSGEVLAFHSVDTPSGDLLDTKRASGSTLKIVVLLAAARHGIGPDAVLDGKFGCRFTTPTGTYDAAAGATTLATGTLRQMTAASINCAFAQLANMLGPDALSRAATDLGIEGLSDLGPRFGVGGNAVTPTELVTALATLLGDGTVRVPHLVRAAEQDGVPLALAPTAHGAATVTETERATVLPSLVAVLDTGTAHESKLSGGRPAAGKTGTQPNNTDAWFVGGTPSFTAVSWLGNPAKPDDGMVDIPQLGFKAVRGASYPAAIWHSVIEHTVAGTPIEPIGVPAPHP